MTIDETHATTTDVAQIPHVQPVDTAKVEDRPPRGRGLMACLTLCAAAIALGGVVYSGIHARPTANTNLKRATVQAAIPTVNVVYPSISAPVAELVLPGNMQAFTDAPIFARTNGYLKRWYVDIGTFVKKGQLLAEIDTPEIDQQLQQARADLKTMQANVDLAKTTEARWQVLLKRQAVSQQETDQAVSDLRVKQATVESNTASVRRLEELQSFQKIYAPFDGVITARNTDIGTLIDAGAYAQGRELFHLAAIRTLRVYVAVPEIYAHAAHPGVAASLTRPAFPNEVLHGTLVRHANAIDPASRTLLTEIDVENPQGQLLPGTYVLVRLTLPQAVHSVTVPVNTLLFRSEGLRVGVVRHGQAELVPVTIGRDYGSTIEVVSGLQPTNPVIVDPADSLIAGMPVRIDGQPAEDAVP